MDTLEQFLKRHIRNEEQGQRGVFCPPATEIAQYVDEILDTQTHQFVEQHVGICQHCKQEVALLKVETDPLLHRAPQETRSYFQNLTQASSTSYPKHSLATIIAAFTSQIIQVIETTGDILGQSLSGPELAVRGENHQSERTRIRHVLGNYALTISLQPSNDKNLTVEITLRNQNGGEPIPNVEVTLEGADKKSQHITDTLGKVSLSDLPFGLYNIHWNQEEFGNQSLSLELRPLIS